LPAKKGLANNCPQTSVLRTTAREQLSVNRVINIEQKNFKEQVESVPQLDSGIILLKRLDL